ncbi:hypothetical protein Apa02nite_024140 [Actinoplanes palleronii]|uniref:Uncharacterized protein n=1 Tax=Actinoplanes palleronii TaxID=113570 RepID=A0ABQ4B6Q0_9ACTN|nr:hypothetical protein Apa02nite_024140 [Actinoplanes palleronii]
MLTLSAAVTSLAVALTVVWLMPISRAADAGSYQATVDAAIAAVAAALLVVIPAVVAVATQALSQFSWRTVSVVAGWRMATSVGVAALLGVCVPLGLAANPSAVTTRAAFTCLVLSIVIVGGATSSGARRATPEWLVNHVARRALRSEPGRRRDLSREVAVLGDLVGSSRLPVAEHRLAAVTWSVTLCSGPNTVWEADDVARSVREVGADLGRETAPVHQAAVMALTALGVRLSWSQTVCGAVLDVLFDLAVQDRAAGRHQVAAEALDGVAEVVVARLVHVMTPQDVLAVVELPAWPDKPAPAPPSRATRLADRALTPRVTPTVRPQLEGSAYDQVHASTREPANVDTISRLLSTLVPDDLSARFPNAAPAPGFDGSYELLESTVDRLLAVLASPRSASIGWSGGHHEAGSFGADIERLTRIGTALYTQRRYSRCDAIETHLETIGVKLIGADSGPSIPADRTGWRVAHLSRRPSPAALIAEALRDLGIAAFRNGYDRRALLTGRRLLSLATAAANADDQVALSVYTDALYLFVNRSTYHTSSPAVAARGAVVIAGLLRESDDLRRALPVRAVEAENPTDRLRYLPWQASGSEFELAAQAWQSVLRAAGWLSESRTARPVTDTVTRLPEPIRELALDELAHQPRATDAAYTTALLLTLWADALAARLNGDQTPSRHLAATLDDLYTACDEDEPYLLEEDESVEVPVEQRHDDADEAPRSRLVLSYPRTLVEVMTAWAITTDLTEAVMPSSEDGSRHLLSVLDQAAGQLRLPNWRYHGVIDSEGEHLVVIEYPDGQTALLRDEEAGARGAFAWGYGGEGPYAFARTLARHAAGPLLRCPDCLGTSPITNTVVTCASCRNSGQRHGGDVLVMLLVKRLISSLPEPATATARPAIAWSRTRTEILKIVTGTTARIIGTSRPVATHEP